MPPPAFCLRTNAEGTLNVPSAAREHGGVKVVHTPLARSTAPPRRCRSAKTILWWGQSPYAASKISADNLAESFHLSFALPVVTVRPFNTFGPRQLSRAIIPTTIS